MSTEKKKPSFSQVSGAPPDFERTLNLAAHEFAASIPLSTPRNLADDAVRRVMGAIRAQALRKPDLWAASPMSLGRAMALSVLTGLMPGGPLPEVDLIPRKKSFKDDSGNWSSVVEIDWQVGFRGYIALARRAGARVHPPQVVYEHELEKGAFVWEEGMDRKLVHRPLMQPGGTRGAGWDGVVLAYVVVRFADGTADFHVMTRDEIEARRARSEAWRNLVAYEEAVAEGKTPTWPNGKPRPKPDCPWADWPVEMAQKTVIRGAAARGMLTFDDLGIVAYEHDSRGDVIEGEAVVRTATRESPKPTPRALPDNDPLELNEWAPAEREKVEVRREEEPAEEQQAAPAPERTPSYTAESDALKLRERLGDWKVPLAEDAVEAALKGALGVSRLKPATRLQAAVDYGVETWGWRIQNDKLLPAREPGEEG